MDSWKKWLFVAALVVLAGYVYFSKMLVVYPKVYYTKTISYPAAPIDINYPSSVCKFSGFIDWDGDGVPDYTVGYAYYKSGKYYVHVVIDYSNGQQKTYDSSITYGNSKYTYYGTYYCVLAYDPRSGKPGLYVAGTDDYEYYSDVVWRPGSGLKGLQAGSGRFTSGMAGVVVVLYHGRPVPVFTHSVIGYGTDVTYVYVHMCGVFNDTMSCPYTLNTDSTQMWEPVSAGYTANGLIVCAKDGLHSGRYQCYTPSGTKSISSVTPSGINNGWYFNGKGLMNLSTGAFYPLPADIPSGKVVVSPVFTYLSGYVLYGNYLFDVEHNAVYYVQPPEVPTWYNRRDIYDSHQWIGYSEDHFFSCSYSSSSQEVVCTEYYPPALALGMSADVNGVLNYDAGVRSVNLIVHAIAIPSDASVRYGLYLNGKLVADTNSPDIVVPVTTPGEYNVFLVASADSNAYYSELNVYVHAFPWNVHIYKHVSAPYGDNNTIRDVNLCATADDDTPDELNYQWTLTMNMSSWEYNATGRCVSVRIDLNDFTDYTMKATVVVTDPDGYSSSATGTFDVSKVDRPPSSGSSSGAASVPSGGSAPPGYVQVASPSVSSEKSEGSGVSPAVVVGVLVALGALVYLGVHRP